MNILSPQKDTLYQFPQHVSMARMKRRLLFALAGRNFPFGKQTGTLLESLQGFACVHGSNGKERIPTVYRRVKLSRLYLALLLAQYPVDSDEHIASWHTVEYSKTVRTWFGIVIRRKLKLIVFEVPPRNICTYDGIITTLEATTVLRAFRSGKKDCRNIVLPLFCCSFLKKD